GYFNAAPLTHLFAHFLEHTPTLPEVGEGAEVVTLGTQLLIMLGGTVFALGGLGLAWWMYGLAPGFADRLAKAVPALYQVSLNKFYLDEIYDRFVVRPLSGFAEFSRIFDLDVWDKIVDLIGQVPRLAGLLFRPIQNGLAQFYALAMALGLAVFVFALVWRFF